MKSRQKSQNGVVRTCLFGAAILGVLSALYGVSAWVQGDGLEPVLFGAVALAVPMAAWAMLRR